MDINELRRQHQELDIIARQLLGAVEDSQTQQSVGIIRWQLARQLMAHLALEDQILYPAMKRLPDEQARSTAQRLQSELGMLARDFSTYMQRWNDDQIARHWAEFCADTREILCRLKERIDQEEKLLYPLAQEASSATPVLGRTG